MQEEANCPTVHSTEQQQGKNSNFPLFGEQSVSFCRHRHTAQLAHFSRSVFGKRAGSGLGCPGQGVKHPGSAASDEGRTAQAWGSMPGGKVPGLSRPR